MLCLCFLFHFDLFYFLIFFGANCYMKKIIVQKLAEFFFCFENYFKCSRLDRAPQWW